MGWGCCRPVVLWAIAVIAGRGIGEVRETWRGLPVTEAGFSLEPESVA
jgi:hypothetical protein